MKDKFNTQSWNIFEIGITGDFYDPLAGSYIPKSPILIGNPELPVKACKVVPILIGTVVTLTIIIALVVIYEKKQNEKLQA